MLNRRQNTVSNTAQAPADNLSASRAACMIVVIIFAGVMA